MIHSAGPPVSPVMDIVFVWNLFYFEKWGRTDRRTIERHVQKQWSLPAVTVGRPSGSKRKQFAIFFLKVVSKNGYFTSLQNPPFFLLEGFISL